MRLMIVALMVTMAGHAGAAEVDLTERAAEVRATEIAFAQSMADRDLAAFTSFIAPDALFLGRTPLRGPEEVAAGWKPFFEGDTPPFSWKPERVDVNADGTLAISTGPVASPDGKVESWYISTWRREANGKWKIIADIGSPRCGCL